MYFLSLVSVSRDAFIQMKQDQAELERQLFQERSAIQAKHEEKVRLAQAKSVNSQNGFALDSLT